MDFSEKKQLSLQACKVRQHIIEGTFNAKSGHPGGSLSAADIITYLYFKEMRVDPKNPKWEDRDRFVLSKGHAAPALYGALAVKGFFPEDEIKNLRKPGSRVYAVLGDGEIQEGQVWEAAMFASHKKLDNLTIFIDNNNLQIDGTMDEVNSPYPIPEKFEAFGWHTVEIDGHDFDQIEKAVEEAKSVKDKPTAVIMHTVKGKGVSFMEDQVGWHGVAPNAEQYENAMNELKAQYSALEAE